MFDNKNLTNIVEIELKDKKHSNSMANVADYTEEH